MKKAVPIFIFSFLLGLLLGASRGIVLADISNPHPTPPANSVTHVMLQPGIIDDSNVATSPAISGTKISTGAADGNVLYSKGNGISTSTKLNYNNGNTELDIVGGTIAATTTSFNGVRNTWPSANGANLTTLTNDGSGNLSWISPAAANFAANEVAGENITQDDAVFVATTTINNLNYKQCTATGSGNNDGDQVAHTSFSEVFTTGAGSRLLVAISAGLSVVGAPIDNLNVFIAYTSGGVPTYNSIATSTISGSALTVTNKEYLLYLSTPVRLATSTTLAVVFKRSGAISNTNYYSVDSAAGSPCGGLEYFDNNGTQTSHVGHDTNYGLNEILYAGAVYRTYYLSGAFANQFSGLAAATALSSSTLKVVMAGLYTPLFSLVQGVEYYVGHATGTIETASTTTNLIVGRAVDQTNLFIYAPSKQN